MAEVKSKVCGTASADCVSRVISTPWPALHARTLDREARELARLYQVLELATHDGCQVARLCAHFGEELPAPCGHCTWCLPNRTPLRLPPRPMTAMDDALWHQAGLLRREQPDPLADPRALARFLCGPLLPHSLAVA